VDVDLHMTSKTIWRFFISSAGSTSLDMTTGCQPQECHRQDKVVGPGASERIHASDDLLERSGRVLERLQIDCWSYNITPS
jgi:hypothetical protein